MGCRGKSGGRKRRVTRPAVAAGAILLAGLVFFPAFAVSSDAEREGDGRARAALVLSTGVLGLQTELPAGNSGGNIENKRGENRNKSMPFPRLSESAARALLWGSVAVALAIIACHAGSNLWSFSRSRRLESAGADEEASAAAVARMDRAQARADELADAADYAEAMHLLLLQSVGELRRRLHTSIAVSLTSREILSNLDLPPGGRESFADIIERVELSHFGGRKPGREEYKACRRSFEALTAALRRGAA